MGVQKRVSRSKLRATIAPQPVCGIGMEACSSSQYCARQFQQIGYTVKLISPQFVKAYVKGNKNDSRDAEAICEAVSRPHMRFVPPRRWRAKISKPSTACAVGSLKSGLL